MSGRALAFLVRAPLVALLVASAGLAGSARAQKLECRPPGACRAPVTFAPTGAAWLAAMEGGAALEPDPGSPSVGFALKRRRGEPFGLEVALGPWATPPGAPLGVAPELEARYLFEDDRGDAIERSAWIPLGAAPTELLRRDERRTDITVEYRLRPGTAAPAGAYEVEVRYRAWDEDDRRDGKDEVAHPVRIEVPTWAAVRTVPDGAAVATIAFDYAADPLAFVRAVAGARPLPPTSWSVEAVEAATNHPTGALVRVEAIVGSGDLRLDDLRLDGRPADAATWRLPGPTGGWVRLFGAADVAWLPGGDEEPGAARVELRYEAFPAP